MTSANAFPWQQEVIIHHSQRILKSFQHWTGSSLLDVNGSPREIAQALFEAPFVLVSHGIEADPIFNYGNRQALAQAERERLLSEAATKGFCYFSGVRITSTGKRFQIQDGILWNLLDEQHQYCGQAAVYSKCTFIT